MNRLRILGMGLLVATSPVAAVADEVPPIVAYLTEAQLPAGAAAMQTALATNADDQQARFSLGVVQFLSAVEGLGKDHYRYGLGAERGSALVFFRLPVPENPRPQSISADDFRAILQSVIDRLALADQTLALVTDPQVRLPLPIADIHLDINGNGQTGPQESLGYVIDFMQRRDGHQADTAGAGELIVGFDAADAIWLRGYCHALSAVAEMILAYDWNDQFARTGHLLYPDVQTPFEYLKTEGAGPLFGFGGQNLLDIIAFIHMINYDLIEPERMPRALKHWEAVVTLSRESWKLIQAETDDFNEWLPNPQQTAAVTELRVGQELVTTWHRFLGEIDAILQGKKLVPFWRGIPGGVNDTINFPRHPTLGVNVRRIFTEPGRFDLALWLQGTGMQPWLEEGDILEPADWNAMLRGFNNNFWPIFFWFN